MAASKNSTSIVLHQSISQVNIQRNGSGTVFKFLLIILKDWQCFLFIREYVLSFKKCSESFNVMPELFLGKHTLFWHCWRTTEVLFLKQPLILPFICHKSATTCQNYSNKASNCKLKPDLCNCETATIIKSTAPPHQPHKRSTIILGHPVYFSNTFTCNF